MAMRSRSGPSTVDQVLAAGGGLVGSALILGMMMSLSTIGGASPLRFPRLFSTAVLGPPKPTEPPSTGRAVWGMILHPIIHAMVAMPFAFAARRMRWMSPLLLGPLYAIALWALLYHAIFPLTRPAISRRTPDWLSLPAYMIFGGLLGLGQWRSHRAKAPARSRKAGGKR